MDEKERAVAKLVIERLEKMFGQDPNQPIGLLVFELRQNKDYNRLMMKFMLEDR